MGTSHHLPRALPPPPPWWVHEGRGVGGPVCCPHRPAACAEAEPTSLGPRFPHLGRLLSTHPFGSSVVRISQSLLVRGSCHCRCAAQALLSLRVRFMWSVSRGGCKGTDPKGRCRPRERGESRVGCTHRPCCSPSSCAELRGLRSFSSSTSSKLGVRIRGVRMRGVRTRGVRIPGSQGQHSVPTSTW